MRRKHAVQLEKAARSHGRNHWVQTETDAVQKDAAQITQPDGYGTYTQEEEMHNPNPGCSACEDMHDGFYGSWASPCPVHNEDGSLKVPTMQQQEGIMSELHKASALQLADMLDALGWRSVDKDMKTAAAELRRLHARVVELEAAPVPKGYVLVSEEALRTLGVLDALKAAAVYPRKSDFATTYPNGGVAAMPVFQPPKT